jgi:hypothetical protein
MTLRTSEPPERVYRLGRRPDPWQWPDWSYAGGDGTFGTRFDDPDSEYRVLYASSQREAHRLRSWCTQAGEVPSR